MANGARNIADFTYIANPPLTHGTIYAIPRHGENSEVHHLRKWLPHELIVDMWLVAVNENLHILRRTGAKSTASRRHEATERELWLWLALYYCDHLVRRLKHPECEKQLDDALCGRLGKTRATKLGAAIDFSEDFVYKFEA